MLSEMTSMDIAEWMAYERLEPFGEKAANFRTARLCSVMAATVPMAKGARRPDTEDFLKDYDRDRFWMDEEAALEEQETQAERMDTSLQASIGTGGSVYGGDAPAVKRIGKRALKPGSKERERIDAILRKGE